MSSTVAHDYDLCPDVKSRLEKRIKDMVAAHGGPVKVIGKPSATGLGVHLIFLSEESPKSTSPRPRPHPRPSTGTPREEEDIEMVESSKSESGSSSDSDMDSSESGSSSDVNTAEWHTPRQQYANLRPPSTRQRPPRRTEDRQPGNWNEGGLASTDVSVTDSLAPITKRRLAPRSDLKGVEADRRRVEEQRLAEVKKIQLEQLRKRVQREAQQLRQRAADLEREAAEEVARLLQEEIEMDDAGESRDMLEEDGDWDRFDVQSNGSYTPTEVYSDEEEELRWWSPSLSPPALAPVPTPAPHTPHSHVRDRSPTPSPPPPPPQLAGPSSLQLGPQVQPALGPLHRQHAVPLALSATTTPPGADEAPSFVVVTRRVVDGLDDLTGSPVRRTKRYWVRPVDLESIYGDSDVEEL